MKFFVTIILSLFSVNLLSQSYGTLTKSMESPSPTLDKNGFELKASWRYGDFLDSNEDIVVISDFQHHIVTPKHVNPGVVFVYKEADDELELIQTINCPDLDNGSNFGLGLHVNKDFLFVGYKTRIEFANGRGSFIDAVEVYKWNGTKFVSSQTLYPDDKSVTHFGSSIDMEGSTLAIGAWSYQDSDGTGAAFVYNLTEKKEWVLESKILHPKPATAMLFGSTVKLYGDQLFVGSKRSPQPLGGGEVIIYNRHPNEGWVHHQTIGNPFPKKWAFFGSCFLKHNDYLLIGCTNEGITKENGENPHGRLYTYKLNGDKYDLKLWVDNPSEEAYSQFATCIFYQESEDLIWVGCPVNYPARVQPSSRGMCIASKMLESGSLKLLDYIEAPEVGNSSFGINMIQGPKGNEILMGAGMSSKVYQYLIPTQK